MILSRLLLLLPVAILAKTTNICYYTDAKCTKGELCYDDGCLPMSKLVASATGSGKYELDGETTNFEVFTSDDCSGTALTSVTVSGIKEGECYSDGTDYAIKFAAASTTGISLALIGALLSFPYLKFA
eukprot:GHVR01053700.1.p1 GENE.GHVR01053700.1~~GHVR01053700.1.p1  ORF type:complete len:128 (-),score=9.22 GHVR01053700.1:199-582(-)